MTRPIYEPTLSRTDAVLGYGSDQLFRRPALSECPCPTDWAVANGPVDDTVANDTVYNIAYDSVDIPTNSTCFQVGATGATKPIDIICSGWYMIQLEAWPDTDIGDFILGLTFSGTGFPYNFSYSAGGLYARLQTSITAASNSLEVPTVATFGPVFIQPRAQVGGTARMGGSVYHALVTPASLDWNFGTLAIVYLGPGLDLPGTDDWNPNGLDGDEQFRTYF